MAREVEEHAGLRETVAAALRAMVGAGWFDEGRAWLVDGPGPAAVVVGPAGEAVAGHEPGPPPAVVAAVAAEGRPRRHEGWQLLPVAHEAVLGLRGAATASDAFLLGVAEVVGYARHRARMHQRLLDKEAQRTRLLRALLSAQEEERGRIARDLHDQIGQSLTALLLGLDRLLEAGAAAAADARPTAPRSQEVARLRELTDVTLADVRRIALDLRPAVLDELGLAAALRRFARELHARYGVAINVLVELPSRLARDAETVLYRVAQEALTNVVRHARAREASIVATASDGWVRLVVEDDGIGFEPDALPAMERIGLVGMRERLELAGGSLRIESAPGHGCSVHARLPT